MAATSDSAAIPGIAALPATTARQIGSGQVLVDPSSVVKELIDNALDARAKSIFVDITFNTIDSIQVKDDGHGIPAENRALACGRYCTSKIRDLQDLREVGGKWLGFRGEALASMAEMSGTLCITTRVEGEPVAVKLKYGRDGELESTERDLHPVGTTVKASKFFEYIPVRKQTALKNSSKCLTNIRRLMQAYALARPAVRFRLHILKAKNDKGDFMYAPKSNSNVKDAVLKVIGKDCALQCDWTALKTHGFEIHAFLPRPTADSTKIANQGAFVSVDSRPVSNSRRTVKQIVAAFKVRLRKSNPSLVGVTDPFFSMNIICPPNSYDPNIEPAKDDVMFDNAEVVLGAVDKLLQSYYPEIVTVEPESVESPALTQELDEPGHIQARRQSQLPLSILEDPPQEAVNDIQFTPGAREPRWRSSMYGIDEDDLEFRQENHPPVIEEEEGTQAAAVSNPWTIALMNAATKPKRAVGNGQLFSPAKSNADGLAPPSSPVRSETPRRPPLAEPLTPQSSSQMNMSQSTLDVELEQSIQHLSHTPAQELTSPHSSGESQGSVQVREPSLATPRHRRLLSVSNALRRLEGSTPVLGSPSVNPTQSFQHLDVPSRIPPPTLLAPNRRQKQQSISKNSPAAPIEEAPDTWFGQPMRGPVPSQPARRQQRHKGPDLSFPTGEFSSSQRRPAVAADKRMFQNRSDLEDNADIRGFFGQDVHRPSREVDKSFPRPSFTAINAPSRSHQIDDQHSHVIDHGAGSSTQSTGRRASSAEPHTRRMQINSVNASAQSLDMADSFRAYAERDRPSSQPLSTTSSSHGLQPHSQTIGDSMRMHNDDGIDPRQRNDFQMLDNSFSNSPAPRPASASSEQISIPPNRSNDVTTALNLYRQDKPSRNAHDMGAHFRAYHEREEASSQLSSSPTRRLAPRTVPPHEKTKTSKRRRPRRHTANGAERTKSSKLPLERVSHDYRMQDVVLSVNWNVPSIVRSSRKLNMSRNSLEWGYSGEEAYDTFAESVTERKVMGWVVTLDDILHEQYKRLSGMDVRSLLHEAIQRGLDARKEDYAVQTIEMTQNVHLAIENKVVQVADEEIPGNSREVKGTLEHSHDELSDFNISQSVAAAVDRLNRKAPVPGEVVEVEDDFEDDIDDDMVMDM